MKAIYKIILLLFPVLGCLSCQKWLDVTPKTQIKSDENFDDAQGFKDALAGVYVSMTSPDLYGKDLSFGLIDVFAKQYTQITISNYEYGDAAQYNYENDRVKTKIDNIWKTGYFTIANVNNLLENLGRADRRLFESGEYEVIKGEAYGLRAFHHFDLLRLFAPSPAAGGKDVPGIPYRDRFEASNIAQSTVGDVLGRILADLDSAARLLKDTDPIVSGSTIPSTTTGYLRNRPYKFNYYAVKAEQARVYLYSGDYANARVCAEEVIQSAIFPPTTVGQIAAGNRVFSTEVIFNLNVNTLADQTSLATSFFNPNLGATKSADQWSTVFDLNSGGSSDYRYLYQTQLVGTSRMPAKLDPLLNTNSLAANRLPLIRLSEMYYIAAECLKDTDPGKALQYLNTVRANRNLLPLSAELPQGQIQQELFKEYAKEFLCEGQLFYYYKRLNLSNIQFYQQLVDNHIYVLPFPDDEIEYGSINN